MTAPNSLNPTQEALKAVCGICPDCVEEACRVGTNDYCRTCEAIESYGNERVVKELTNMHTGFTQALDGKDAGTRYTMQPIMRVIEKRIGELR